MHTTQFITLIVAYTSTNISPSSAWNPHIVSIGMFRVLSNNETLIRRLQLNKSWTLVLLFLVCATLQFARALESHSVVLFKRFVSFDSVFVVFFVDFDCPALIYYRASWHSLRTRMHFINDLDSTNSRNRLTVCTVKPRTRHLNKPVLTRCD